MRHLAAARPAPAHSALRACRPRARHSELAASPGVVGTDYVRSRSAPAADELLPHRADRGPVDRRCGRRRGGWWIGAGHRQQRPDPVIRGIRQIRVVGPGPVGPVSRDPEPGSEPVARHVGRVEGHGHRHRHVQQGQQGLLSHPSLSTSELHQGPCPHAQRPRNHPAYQPLSIPPHSRSIRQPPLTVRSGSVT